MRLKPQRQKALRKIQKLAINYNDFAQMPPSKNTICWINIRTFSQNIDYSIKCGIIQLSIKPLTDKENL